MSVEFVIHYLLVATLKFPIHIQDFVRFLISRVDPFSNLKFPIHTWNFLQIFSEHESF